VKVISFRFYTVEVDDANEAFPRGRKVARPQVPFRLTYKGRRTPAMLGIIDSGADECIFDTSLADVLGIDLEHCPESKFHSASSGLATVRYCKVTLEIGTEKGPEVGYDITAGFSKLPAVGLLGQCGFFDRFVVTVNQSAGLGTLRYLG